ncbi:MAG: DNA (cytosine-5-)-methyltransferase [Streptosporangiales bacterium]|nr:DNA (cytosine-5-)-methyltransferase [Streptosporangiales bacterium]
MSSRNGRVRNAVVVDSPTTSPTSCPACRADLERLTRRRPPTVEKDWPVLSVVDLFCGCGGMTIGLLEAAADAKRRLRIPLAVDDDPTAADTFLRNFPSAGIECAKVESLIDGELGAPLTAMESRLPRKVGPVSILVAGPPCQGHSDLNNKTRRNDPRNALYARVARAAVVLKPAVVIVENVPQVANDHGQVVDLTACALEAAGYRVHLTTLDLRKVGVPQRRKRHVLLAVSGSTPSPREILDGLGGGCADHVRTVEWAIGDLEDVEPVTAFDRASTPSPENRERIDKLFDENIHDLDNDDRPPCHRDKKHTYRSMYGRLWWDQPAQTITTGFGSMGQGRYVHPTRRRTITPHEAARLQTIPDYVQLGLEAKRGAWAQMIGNAVPAFLTRALGRALIPHLTPLNDDDVAWAAKGVGRSSGHVTATPPARGTGW